MEGIESEGRTVAEAVEGALARMGLRRDQVEVQILDEGKAGFMGIGAKPARVRLVEKRWGEPSEARAPQAPRSGRGAERSSRSSRPAPKRQPAPQPRPAPAAAPAVSSQEEAKPVDPEAACAEARKRLSEVLRLMTFEATVGAVSWDSVQERVLAPVDGTDAERLLAQEGRLLEALQYLVTLMVGRSLGTPVAVQVDALGYWKKREGEVIAEARRGVETVKSTGKPFRLAPMDSTMRRLIHRDLADHPDVVTASEGEGTWRKIVLKPRKG